MKVKVLINGEKWVLTHQFETIQKKEPKIINTKK